MTNTPFAGLEIVPPGGTLSQDGYRFQSVNPVITDFLLKIGAVLHKHDAHVAMPDPTDAPVVTVAPTGGALAPNSPIYVAYTLTDSQGGETLPTDVVAVTTPEGFSDPTGAPDAVVDFSAGALLANTFLYAISVADGHGGETALGPAIEVLVNPAANAQALLSGLASLVTECSGGAPDASWRIWRSVDGGSTWRLMATGTTDGWTDDASTPGDCSVIPLSVGTTGGYAELNITVPAAGQPADAQFFTVYASQDGSFLTPALLGIYPIAQFDAVLTFATLALQAGQPPRASTCVGGANLIDPDTDILEWPWKRPVAVAGDLPATGNTEGDSRIVVGEHAIYIWSGTAWVPVIGGSSGSVIISTAYTADHTLAIGDPGTALEIDGGDLHIPLNADVPLPIGAVIEVFQAGVTPITVIADDVSITLQSDGSRVMTAGQYATIGLRQRDTDVWVLSGDLA